MYPEFVAIYVGIGIVMLLLIVVLALIIIVLNKITKMQTKNNRMMANGTNSANQGKSTVFCPQCATPFSSKEGFCPKCGAAR